MFKVKVEKELENSSFKRHCQLLHNVRCRQHERTVTRVCVRYLQADEHSCGEPGLTSGPHRCLFVLFLDETLYSQEFIIFFSSYFVNQKFVGGAVDKEHQLCAEKDGCRYIRQMTWMSKRRVVCLQRTAGSENTYSDPQSV